MTDFEREFETLVKSIRFDDTPSETHRRQLEQELLDAYDRRGTVPAVPSGLFYLKRLAIAAGFLVAAGVFYLLFDGSPLAPNGQPAHAPDAQTVQRILLQEGVSDSERAEVLADIQRVWKLITADDAQGLTAVVLDPQTAESVRVWAGENLAKIGTEQTLGMLEKQIEVQGLTAPEDPVVQTAQRLRRQLDAQQPTP